MSDNTFNKNLIKEGQYNALNTRDSRLNYVCGTKGFENDIKTNLVSTDPIDYSIGKNPELEPEAEFLDLPDTRMNLSFLQVKTIKEGIEWYRKLDPKIPEELLPLMARWNWGDLATITKKQVKNENKKAVKKGKSKTSINSIKIKKEPFLVSFN